MKQKIQSRRAHLTRRDKSDHGKVTALLLTSICERRAWRMAPSIPYLMKLQPEEPSKPIPPKQPAR